MMDPLHRDASHLPSYHEEAFSQPSYFPFHPQPNNDQSVQSPIEPNDAPNPRNKDLYDRIVTSWLKELWFEKEVWRHDPYTCSLGSWLVDIIDDIEQAILKGQ